MDKERYPDGAPLLSPEELQGTTATALFHLVKAVHSLRKALMSITPLDDEMLNSKDMRDYVTSIDETLDIIEKMRGF